MRTIPVAAVNLASQPFRRERARNAAYMLLCGVLLLTLAVQVAVVLNGRKEAAGLRRAIEVQRTELSSLEHSSQGIAAVLSRPANADVFSRSVFYNELISRRALSWTVAFRDLEHLLPTNVKLIGIRLPQLNGAAADAASAAAGVNRVQLDMIVGADKPEDAIELLKRLAQSSLFGPARLLGQQPPNQTDPTYKFRVTVPYGQRL